jgi:alpha-tubulin suppressor-like RCC1 family protein
VLVAVVAAVTVAMAPPAFAITTGVAAWGVNGAGQLGNGTTEPSDVPVPVSGLGAPTAASAGASHSLALMSGGSVMAWGDNGVGQLGNPNFHGTFDVPVAVGINGVTAVSAGGAFSLALGGGFVSAWGGNNLGQLGTGHPEYGLDSEPQQVVGLSGVVAISAGSSHSLALLSDGTVAAWGYNASGQLGNGTTETSYVPVAVSGLSGVVAVSAGNEFSLALRADGTAMAWGNDGVGQLGDGTHASSDVPVPVSELREFTAISAGGSHALGLLTDGTVLAWGDNSQGELGDGTHTSRDIPVAVSSLGGVTAISAANHSSLALLSNSTVRAWGANLGNGTTESSSVPVEVSGLSGITAISAGGDHSLAFAPPRPIVTGVSPASGAEAGGTSVTITGTTFTGATAVRFGSSEAASFTVDSATSITATSPPGTGFVDVTVTTPAGTSAVGSADQFRYGPPLPVIANITPHSGPPAGGTAVSISGSSLTGATAVKFGASDAASFSVNSDTSISAVAPGGAGKVDVSVTTPKGTSSSSPGDRFSYAAGAPEFGRCIKVAKGQGRYKTANCTTLLTGGSYEWTTAITHTHFTTKIKAAPNPVLRLQTVSGAFINGKLVCKGETGTGEYSSPKEVAGVVLAFTGCERFRGQAKVGEVCSSEGAATGEISTNALEGVLGIISTSFKGGKEVRTVGLDLVPVGRTGALLGPVVCNGSIIGVAGSIIGKLVADKMSVTGTLAFVSASGKQTPEQFEGEPKDVLEGVLYGGFASQMGLTLSMTQTNEEAVEVNAFA